MVEKIRSPEFIDKNPLAKATLTALTSAVSQVRKIGEVGKKFLDRPNQFDEQTLHADLLAEQAVIDFFARYAEKNGITIKVRGEETVTSTLRNGEQKYFAVLDGLDGS